MINDVDKNIAYQAAWSFRCNRSSNVRSLPHALLFPVPVFKNYSYEKLNRIESTYVQFNIYFFFYTPPHRFDWIRFIHMRIR